MKRSVASFLIVLSLFTAVGVAVLSFIELGSTPAQAAPTCRCYLTVAPVTCSNGKTYVNQCFANCDHAKDCVRTD